MSEGGREGREGASEWEGKEGGRVESRDVGRKGRVEGRGEGEEGGTEVGREGVKGRG